MALLQCTQADLYNAAADAEHELIATFENDVLPAALSDGLREFAQLTARAIRTIRTEEGLSASEPEYLSPLGTRVVIELMTEAYSTVYQTLCTRRMSRYQRPDGRQAITVSYETVLEDGLRIIENAEWKHDLWLTELRVKFEEALEDFSMGFYGDCFVPAQDAETLLFELEEQIEAARGMYQ